MASVVYHSVFYNLSGYAAESRGLVSELDRRGFAVRIGHAGDDSPKDLQPEEDTLLKRLEETPVDPSHALFIVAHPPLFCRRVPGRCVVLRTMYETDRIHREWVERCDQFDEIWVPSTQNREAFIASGLPPDKVRIVRGGIDTEVFRPGVKPLVLDRRKEFAFLSVFDWQWRKGWDLLLSAYCQEFRPDEPVTLYLKVHDLSKQTAIVSELHYYVRHALNLQLQSAPDIVLFDRVLRDSEMAGLYAAADAFILPTRGEGYGRPFLEAMACGLPVIGTAWGGQTDFLTEENGYPLRITGLETVPDYEPREWYRGLRWAAPDLKELRRLMRCVYTDREEGRRKGAVAHRQVVEGWDYRHAGARMAEEINRVLAERGLGRGGVGAT